jgi:hypothetical protein
VRHLVEAADNHSEVAPLFRAPIELRRDPVSRSPGPRRAQTNECSRLVRADPSSGNPERGGCAPLDLRACGVRKLGFPCKSERLVRVRPATDPQPSRQRASPARPRYGFASRTRSSGRELTPSPIQCLSRQMVGRSTPRAPTRVLVAGVERVVPSMLGAAWRAISGSTWSAGPPTRGWVKGQRVDELPGESPALWGGRFGSRSCVGRVGGRLSMETFTGLKNRRREPGVNLG